MNFIDLPLLYGLWFYASVFHSEDNVSYGLCTNSPLEFRSRGDKSYRRLWAEGMHAAWILSAVLGGLFQPSTESSGSGVRATLPSSLPIPLLAVVQYLMPLLSDIVCSSTLMEKRDAGTYCTRLLPCSVQKEKCRIKGLLFNCSTFTITSTRELLFLNIIWMLNTLYLSKSMWILKSMIVWWEQLIVKGRSGKLILAHCH